MLQKSLVILAILGPVSASPLASSANASDPDVCVSRGCIEVASYLLQSMNASADPCNDFHNFACGNWAKSHLFGKGAHSTAELKYFKQIELIHDLIDDSKWINSVAFKKMHHYLDMCKGYVKNETRIEEEIQPLLKDLPPLSLLGDKFEESKFNLTHLLAKQRLISEGKNLISVGLYVVFYNSTMNATSVPTVTIKLPSYTTYLRNKKEYAKELVEIESLLKDQIGLLQLYSNKNTTKVNVTTVVNELLDFETTLAELEVKHEATSKETEAVTEEELKQILPMLDIRAFLAMVVPDLKYDFTKGIVIMNKALILELAKLWKTNPSVIANDFGLGYSRELIKLYTPVVCKDATKPLFDPLIDHLFAKRFMTQQDIVVGKEMMDTLMVSVEEIFAEAEWLDEATRTKAIEKARAAYMQFGPHRQILNLTYLDHRFEELDILNEKDWISVLRKVQEYQLSEYKKGIESTMGQDEFAKSAPTTQYNAVNLRQFNTMVIYSAFAQAPLFRGYYPLMYSYGALGFIGGHEITHSYDNQGKSYGPYGATENWWTPEAEAAFINRSQCFIDYFNNFTDELSGLKENGKLTLGENIADTGGIAIVYKAFQAYKKKHQQSFSLPGLTQFSDDQIFFLSSVQFLCDKRTALSNREMILTDEHALSKFRARNIATNTKEFAEAFKCPKGSAHNPEKRCKIW